MSGRDPSRDVTCVTFLFTGKMPRWMVGGAVISRTFYLEVKLVNRRQILGVYCYYFIRFAVRGGGHNVAGLGAVRSRGASQNFAGPTEEEKVLVQRNGILDSISFTVARATIPTNYWVSG